MYDDENPQEDGPVDILFLVDSLEELVGVGKRVPFSGRVMVEEVDFLALIDQLRAAVPDEIKKAQKVIKERARILAEAHEEAAKIQEAAKQRAEYYVSKEGILNEARQQAEEVLRSADEKRKRSLGEIDAYALDQLNKVEDALRVGLTHIDDAVRETVNTLNEARGLIGR